MNKKLTESDRKSDVKKRGDNKPDKPDKEESGIGKNEETTAKPRNAGKHISF
jgi:hypothetical protein